MAKKVLAPTLLGPKELVKLAEDAGFKGDGPDNAPLSWTMAAIALRESYGDPKAFNSNAKTGDQSYGLWQINMIGKWGPLRRKQFGIQKNEELFDPKVNAKAAFLTYGGNQKNLHIAWYIEEDPAKPAFYRDRYLKHLDFVRREMLKGIS